MDNQKQKSEIKLTPRGERVVAVWNRAKDMGKSALNATEKSAVVAVTATAVAVGGTAIYDAVGPKEVVASSPIDIGDQASRDGDISSIETAIDNMGVDSEHVRGVVATGQSVRKEAEKAGTTEGTITVYESPVFGNQTVDVNFPDSKE